MRDDLVPAVHDLPLRRKAPAYPMRLVPGITAMLEGRDRRTVEFCGCSIHFTAHGVESIPCRAHGGGLSTITQRVNKSMADALGWRYCGRPGFHRVRAGRWTCDCGIVRRSSLSSFAAEYERKETDANRNTASARCPRCVASQPPDDAA